LESPLSQGGRHTDGEKGRKAGAGRKEKKNLKIPILLTKIIKNICQIIVYFVSRNVAYMVHTIKINYFKH